jgi:hypothetical protein
MSNRQDEITRHYWQVKLGRPITDKELEFFKLNKTASQGNPNTPTIDQWQAKVKDLLNPGGIAVMIAGDRLWKYRKPEV